MRCGVPTRFFETNPRAGPDRHPGKPSSVAGNQEMRIGLRRRGGLRKKAKWEQD